VAERTEDQEAVFAARRRDLLEALGAGLREDVTRRFNVLEASGCRSVGDIIALVRNAEVPRETRMIGCSVLGLLREPRAAEALLQVMSSGDADLMWEAAKALALIPGVDVFESLVAYLVSDGVESSAAAWVLGRRVEKRAVDKLIACLHDQARTVEMRGHAAEAIGSAGDAGALGALVPYLDHARPELRFWAVSAIGEICDRVVISAIRNRLHDAAVTPFGTVSEAAQEVLDRLVTAIQDDADGASATH
jgi:HEAT repeat protein